MEHAELLALYTVLFSSIVAPVAVAVVNYLIRRSERKLDYGRQDEVAKRAEQSAKDASQMAKAADTKLDSIHSQGETIHKLVNSKLSAALQAEHDACVGHLAALQEIVSLKTTKSGRPSKATLVAIDVLIKRIAELRATLDDRKGQTELLHKRRC